MNFAIEVDCTLYSRIYVNSFYFIHFYLFICHKHNHNNLQAIEMKVESLIAINNVHGRHIKDINIIKPI